MAWRFWSVHPNGMRLRSPYHETDWEAGEPLAAKCLSPQLSRGPAGHRHRAPHPRCRCGIYGGTYRDLRAFLNTDLAQAAGVPVLGCVSLWGTVLAENNAWRASLAYPERLFVPTFLRGAFSVATELEAYGVPVQILDVQDLFNALHPEGRAPFIASG